MKDYTFLTDYFRYYLASDGIHWIFWKAGVKTQEGFLSWLKMGIKPFQPQSNIYRSAVDLHKEIEVSGLPRMEAEYDRRTKPLAADKLRNRINSDLGNLAPKAYRLAEMLFEKAETSNQSIVSTVNRWRHQATSYDQDLDRGGDRLLGTMKNHNDLIEILQYFKVVADEINAIPKESDTWQVLRQYRKLAAIDHNAFIGQAMAQIEHRRVA